MSLANKLTLFRIALIPVFLAVLYLPYDGMRVLAAALFFIAALTDILDGHVARRQKTVSNFGKIMDPIADKLLVLSGLVVLIQWQEVPAWVGVVLLGREFLISGLRLVVLSDGGNVISASWLGKCKTILQDIAVICLLLQKDFLFLQDWYISLTVLSLAVLFTVWSAIDYVTASRQALRGGGAV
ncbi:MAG: CDP-diacylglycerol--glycerol-3-phosphate 3-phosphatidyltransferase [Eubacteriales bacterium]|nr:CDP-diacylglycerol--glycerol-3-phosphate 3-phosphatidyltransferase [Eubacteriales bacterium]